jgi:replicative DNA helicase
VSSVPRQQPQSAEAEVHVLGGLLFDETAFDAITDSLSADDFFEERHRIIFEVIEGLLNDKRSADSLSVYERIKQMGRLDAIGGGEYLAEIEEAVPSAAFVRPHAIIVREKASLRRMIRSCAQIVEQSYGDIPNVRDFLEEAEKEVFEVRQRAEKDLKTEPQPLAPLVEDALLQLEARQKNPTEVLGVATLFTEFDKMTSGMQPGQLIIIAARPAMGKTSLALNMAVNAATCTDQDVAVAVFSLEMSAESLAMRMLSSEARVDSAALQKGSFGRRDVDALVRAMGTLGKASIFVDDTPALTALGLRGKCRRLKARGQLDLVVVDYLQLMHGGPGRGGRESREREIADISRSLKTLAMELSIPVICLSQLNREVEKRVNKRPMLSDLRESGSIEQDADIIAFIHRDDK